MTPSAWPVLCPAGQRWSAHLQRPGESLSASGHLSQALPDPGGQSATRENDVTRDDQWWDALPGRPGDSFAPTRVVPRQCEPALRLHPPGSYLIRNCESARKDYSLSLKSSHGYMHMRIQLTPSGHYILGQFSRPFASIADMVNYYTVNRLPIKGAEHVSLKAPLCEQLL